MSSHIHERTALPNYDAYTSELHSHAYNLDYRITCAFAAVCLLDPNVDSIFCVYHHRLVVHHNRGRILQPQRERPFNCEFQTDIVFTRPSQESLTMAAIREVHCINATYEVWTVDTEYAILKDWHSIPYVISIRNAKTDGIFLSTPVDYNGISLNDLKVEMQKEFQSTHKDSDAAPHWTRRRYFTHFYNAPQTNGMGLVAIGRALRAADFSIGIHRLFSWWALSDLTPISCALQVLDALFDQIPIHKSVFRDRKAAVLQAYELARLMKQTLTLSSASFKWVDGSISHPKNLTFHNHDIDTYANYRLLRLPAKPYPLS